MADLMTSSEVASSDFSGKGTQGVDGEASCRMEEAVVHVGGEAKVAPRRPILPPLLVICRHGAIGQGLFSSSEKMSKVSLVATRNSCHEMSCWVARGKVEANARKKDSSDLW